jgi:hypothetical protein
VNWIAAVSGFRVMVTDMQGSGPAAARRGCGFGFKADQALGGAGNENAPAG